VKPSFLRIGGKAPGEEDGGFPYCKKHSTQNILCLAWLSWASVFLALSSGCGERDQNGGEPPSLAGLWRIDSESLLLLTEKLDFDSHTNMVDHVLLLNEDGSCAYRGVDFSYDWKPFRTSALSDMIDKYERTIYWHEFTSDGKIASLRPNVERSWYLLDRGRGMIIGPYATNSFANPDSSLTVCVNRWTQWRLAARSDFTENGSLSDENYRVRCRWHVQLKNNSHRTDFFHVGIDEHGFYLWKPAIYHYDYAGPGKIVFRRVKRGENMTQDVP